ncbi:MAG: thiol-disulfide isomerase/thioredoxin, partial [Kiritimatiellia bacterium]
YLDGWEMAEGSDPTDHESRIYTGNWPYNTDKDALGGQNQSEAPYPAVGVKFPQLQVMDQYGDTFDLYDMLGQDVPVVVDISAEWCPPCKALSTLVSGQGGSMQRSWPNVHKNIEAGKVRWVTVLGQNNRGGQADQATLHKWDQVYPNELIPVVATDAAFNGKYLVKGWPTVYLLSPDGTITHMPDYSNPNRADHWQAITAADRL